MRLFLSGNEAIAFGLVRAGVRFMTGYPGTPSSEILPTAVKLKKQYGLKAYFEWSVNEKSAFEEATAASIAHIPSAVTCKQVGLNVAMDPFMNTAMVGSPGGMVVVVADDPGPHSSQTEQDSRFLAMFAKVPVFDPSSPGEAYLMAEESVRLSREFSMPVMLRTTTRVSHSREDIEVGNLNGDESVEPRFVRDVDRYAATPHFRYLLHRELNEKIERIRERNGYRLVYDGEYLILTSGISFSCISDIVDKYGLQSRVSVAKIDMPYPLNFHAIDKLVKNYKETIVIEESYPTIEMQLMERRSVHGRLDGSVPSEGELTPAVIEEILHSRGIIEEKKSVSLVKPPFKRPSMCPGCGHRSAFFAIKKVFGKNAIYTGDIGCYTLGLNLKVVDTVHCMGASVSFAFGFEKAFSLADTKKPIVATIGDSTFFHSGIAPLINAVHNSSPFLLVVLDNATVAMTGNQLTPQNSRRTDGSDARAVDIESIVKSLGIGFVETEDAYNVDRSMEILKRAKDYIENSSGPAVVILRHPCVYTKEGLSGNVRFSSVYVDEGNCRGCNLCVEEFECPSLVIDRKRGVVKIDVSTCIMCGQCVYSCPFGAIKVKP